MSPSGAELLRQIKSRIEEIDPSKVHELIDEGVALIDVRDTGAVGARILLDPAPHAGKTYEFTGKLTTYGAFAEGFSQADLARELGVTRQAIQKMIAVGAERRGK